MDFYTLFIPEKIPSEKIEKKWGIIPLLPMESPPPFSLPKPVQPPKAPRKPRVRSLNNVSYSIFSNVARELFPRLDPMDIDSD